MFDHHTVPGVSPAEAGVRVPVVEYLDGAPLSAADLSRFHQGEPPPEDWLDFALLRLAHPVPEVPASDGSRTPRGHYRLDPAEYAFAKAGPLTVVQHPLGQSQRVCQTLLAARSSASGTRVTYQTNTAMGSSGAALIDGRGRLVALHHYFTGAVNQGIPISAIAGAVTGGPHPEALRTRASAAAAPILLSWSEQDAERARWVGDVLASAGHDVRLNLPGERPRTDELRTHMDAGGRVFALVSPAYLADEKGSPTATTCCTGPPRTSRTGSSPC